MKIQIKNLGPVKDATIDLSKKMNVFCGGNSTGKTYMAYMLYAITSLGNKSLGIRFDKKYIDKLIESNEVEIPLDISEMFVFKEEEIAKIKPNLWRVFSIPESKSSDFFSTTEILFKETEEEFVKRIKEIRFEELIKFQDYTLKVNKETGDSIKVELLENTIKNEVFIRYMEIAFLAMLYSKLVYYPVMSAAIFPVERNSIFTFNKELSIKNNARYDLIKDLDDKRTHFDLEEAVARMNLFLNSLNRYPQAIGDIHKINWF